MMKNTKRMREDVVSFANYKAKKNGNVDDGLTHVHIDSVVITGCEGPNDDNRFPFGKEISLEEAQVLINKEDYKLYASGVGYYDKCFVQPKFTVNGEEKAISDYLKYSSDLRLDLGDGAKYGYENISIIEQLKSILENSGGLKNVTIDNKEVPYDKDAYEKEFGTLDANIDKYLDSHKVELPQDVDYSKKTKEEITVGDIFHNEYDFYTVTRKTKSSVWLAPLKAKNLSVPIKGNGRIDYSRYVYPTKEINQELLEKGTYKVDFKKPFRLTDKYSNYLRAEQGAGHYKAVVYAWNGKSLFAESFEEKSIYTKLNEEVCKFLEDKSDDLKKIFADAFKGGKMNCFETAKGVVYVEPQGEQLVYGGMTNAGIIPEYKFDYDFGQSFDWNLQGHIEQIMEEEGYPIDEDYSDLQNDKSLDVYRKVLNGNKIIDDYVFQDKKHVLVKFHNVKAQDRKQVIILDDKFEERLNKAYNKCKKVAECKESYHPFDTEGKVETRNYKGIEYTVLPNGEYGDIKIYAPKGQSFNNGDTFYSTSSKLTDTDELVKKIVDGQIAKGYFVLGESLTENDKFFKKGKLTSLPKKPAKFNVGDKVTVDNKKGEIIKVKPMKLSDTCVYDIKLEDGKIVDRYEEEINESLKDDCIDIVVPYDLATYISNGDRSPIDFDKETYEPMFDKAEEYQRMGDVEILDDTEDYDVLTDDFGFQNHVVTIRIHKNINESIKENIKPKFKKGDIVRDKQFNELVIVAVEDNVSEPEYLVEYIHTLGNQSNLNKHRKESELKADIPAMRIIELEKLLKRKNSQEDVIESLKEAEETVEEKLKKIEDEIRAEIEKLYGDDKDLMEFFFVESGVEKGYYDDGSDRNYIEVRAELNYNNMVELAEKLDSILQKYDEDAYFDQETGGIMSAVIDFDRKDYVYVAPYRIVIKDDNETEPTFLHCDTFEEGRDFYLQIANSSNRKKIEKLTFEKLDGDTYKTIEEISPKTIGESLNESKDYPKMLSTLLRKCWYDGNGRFARNGKWSIGLGGYDHGYEVYFDGDTIVQIKPDNEVYFGRDERTVKEICSYDYEQILKAIQEVEPNAFIKEDEYKLIIEFDSENLDEIYNIINNLNIAVDEKYNTYYGIYSNDEDELDEIASKIKAVDKDGHFNIRIIEV